MSPVWRNHAGNQSSTVLEERAPASLEELVALVREAEARGVTVRAVGAAHAWSDVALTTGIVVLPTHLGGVVEVDRGGDAPRVRVLGGTHIRDLNEALRAEGLALPNMGGYDAQTIAGVISTSTHGSGLDFGPFPDLVRSIDLVIAGGAVVRVEPAGGPTAPGAFGDGELIQDDDVFAAAICGMGTLGLVWSVLLEVRDVFWLQEVRTVRGWEAIRDTVTATGVLAEHQHYELFINPYRNQDDGTHHVLVTTRDDIPEPADGGSPGRGLRHPLIELASSLPITGVGLRLLARHLPRLMVKRFDGTLKDMSDPGYRSISYQVFNIGEANKLPAVSMELGVTLEGDRHLLAVDRLLAIAEREARRGVFHTSPVALRFTGPSKAYASMMHDQPTMMIELIMVTGSHRGDELLATYERELADLDVRAHWGQINGLTPEDVRRLYPRWPDWMAVEQRFNASGVFAAPFTRRVGISA
jgi:hypothetical protein